MKYFSVPLRSLDSPVSSISLFSALSRSLWRANPLDLVSPAAETTKAIFFTWVYTIIPFLELHTWTNWNCTFTKVQNSSLTVSNRLPGYIVTLKNHRDNIILISRLGEFPLRLRKSYFNARSCVQFEFYSMIIIYKGQAREFLIQNISVLYSPFDTEVPHCFSRYIKSIRYLRFLWKQGPSRPTIISQMHLRNIVCPGF